MKELKIKTVISVFGIEVFLTYDNELYHYTIAQYSELPQLIANFEFY